MAYGSVKYICCFPVAVWTVIIVLAEYVMSTVLLVAQGIELYNAIAAGVNNTSNLMDSMSKLPSEDPTILSIAITVSVMIAVLGLVLFIGTLKDNNACLWIWLVARGMLAIFIAVVASRGVYRGWLIFYGGFTSVYLFYAFIVLRRIQEINEVYPA